MEPASTRTRRERPTKGDRREAAILEVTEGLLNKGAYVDITMDDIARGAGISRPSLYFYFATKEDVLLCLIDQLIGEVRAQTADIQQQLHGDIRTAIQTVLKSAIQTRRQHPGVARAATENWAISSRLRQGWEGVLLEIVDVVEQVITAERAAGRAPAAHRSSSRAVATALAMMNEYCFYLAEIDSQLALSDEELATTLGEICLLGVYGTLPAENRV
jgi:AcrR family transcriptional regulator